MHPYKQFPERQFWHHAVSGTPWAELFRHERGKFTIAADQSVASAGSCFAQRISRLIAESGLDYTDYEPAHPLVPPARAAELGYGLFSCRYGNVYTTRQLRQLVDEALGHRPQIDRLATDEAGRVIDLMRPNINKVGFESFDEAVADRAWHLQCVARMLERCKVLIVTLGLTETWLEPDTGIVYGTHPEVVTRQPCGRPLQAHNLDYIECYNDLVAVFQRLREINPALRLIFTVSPVALAATHQPQHVLVASSYSKAVLRAVAGKFAALLPQVDYFPSLEIFNASQSFGQFLSEDLRDVNRRGVEVAMATFRRMFLAPDAGGAGCRAAAAPAVPAPATAHAGAATSGSLADVECDEILNAFFERRHGES